MMMFVTQFSALDLDSLIFFDHVNTTGRYAMALLSRRAAPVVGLRGKNH